MGSKVIRRIIARRRERLGTRLVNYMFLVPYCVYVHVLYIYMYIQHIQYSMLFPHLDSSIYSVKYMIVYSTLAIIKEVKLER